jgi:hypothetical protein
LLEKSGGIIIFDDMQHPPHLVSAITNCLKYNIKFTELKDLTLDKIGRWAGMGIKP